MTVVRFAWREKDSMSAATFSVSLLELDLKNEEKDWDVRRGKKEGMVRIPI